MNTILEDEITEEYFMSQYKKPVLIFVIVVMSLLSISIIPILIYVCLFLFFKIAFLILNCRRLMNKRKEDKRTQCIVATIRRINVIEEVDFDKIQIQCEANINGTNKRFISKKIRGMTQYKIGDKVEVMIQPDCYNNYQVMVDELS